MQLLESKPTLLVVNETFLNRSVPVDFPGYVVAGRRDRFCSDTNAHVDSLQTWGGVLLLVAKEFDGFVVQLLSSDTAERLWFLLHYDVGPLLLCVWYRPPAPGDITAISTFHDELDLLRNDVLGSLVVGDLNCHHEGWLRFSSGVSTEGRFLKQVCA